MIKSNHGTTVTYGAVINQWQIQPKQLLVTTAKMQPKIELSTIQVLTTFFRAQLGNDVTCSITEQSIRVGKDDQYRFT